MLSENTEPRETPMFPTTLIIPDGCDSGTYPANNETELMLLMKNLQIGDNYYFL